MTSEFRMPFHLDSSGKIASVENPDDQIRQHVMALINTNPVERVTVPGYGVPLLPLLFESMDGDEIATQVSTRVTDAMETWEPGVELVDVHVVEAETHESTSVVSVQYARKDAADTASAANTNTAIIGPTGTVLEIVRG